MYVFLLYLIVTNGMVTQLVLLNSCECVYLMFLKFLLKNFKGEIVDYFTLWTMLVFIGAADCKIVSLFQAQLNTLLVAVVMILHMWAIYNQSRLILGMLLMFYTILIILFLVDRVVSTRGSGM